MSSKSPSNIILFTITIAITIVITVTATPIATDPADLLRLPSDLLLPTSSLCPVGSIPGSCPVKCFRPDPVCGADNVTYWCGCSEARCAGVNVAKVGFCDFEDGSSGQVSGQALLLVHIVWLILLGFFVLFGLF